MTRKSLSNFLLLISGSIITVPVFLSFNMFAKEAIYSKVNNLIELYENVKIIRNGEIVTGDYARINTLDKSYKITSNKSNKVKLLIETSDE